MWEVTTGCESCAMEEARPPCPWAAVGMAGQHTATSRAGVEGAGGTGGAGGRWRGLAGQHTDTPTDWRPRGGRKSVGATNNAERPPPTGTPSSPSRRTAHATPATPVGPQYHTAARQPNTPRRHNKTARPHRGRAAQPISVTHRRITTMSGSPRPLSWRTLEMPSLAATSFAVPSMRRSS